MAMRRSRELPTGISRRGPIVLPVPPKTDAEKTMKKLLLSMAVTAGFAGSALAADMAPRTPIYKAPPPVVHTWTGCYIGAGGGYGMFNVDHSQRNTTTGAGVTINETSGGRGWLATGQVGCDYQFNDRWVVGVFGDFDATFYRGDYGTSLAGTPALVGTLKQDWAWAAGARVGYLVTPSLLTFVDGGFTQAHYKQVDLTTLGGAASGVSLEAQTFNGFFIGSGAEYAIDWFPGLFWKSEARASYYQRKDVNLACTAVGLACTGIGAATGITESRQPTVYSVRSELVYRFNWGGPIVARY
jgi:outer membrane immunogenic protein